MTENRIGKQIVDIAVQIHREMGPGLLETVYEIILAQSVKTLSNYANHIQHTEVDNAFAAFQWEPVPA